MKAKDSHPRRGPSPNSPGTRRAFLRRAVLAAGTCLVVPSHVLGRDGALPPSERLNIAGIGVAGQGGQDILQFPKENMVALCDVDWAHAAGTFKKFPAAKQYKDFRKMLDGQKDIDAVIVATPDHVHAFASMYAIKLGKHVYCEKPLTHSVWEATPIPTWPTNSCAANIARVGRSSTCRNFRAGTFDASLRLR